MKDNCEEEISKFRICIVARINCFILFNYKLFSSGWKPMFERRRRCFRLKEFSMEMIFSGIFLLVVGKREGKQAVVNNSFRGGNESLAGQELRRYLDAVPLEYTEDDFPETNHPRLRRASKLCSRHEFGNASRLFSRIHWPKWVARGHLR